MTLSASDILLEYVCPGLGILIGNAMFAAPVRTCYQRVVEGQGLQTLNVSYTMGFHAGQLLWLDHLQRNAPGFCISFWLNLQASKMQYETFRTNEWKALLVSKLEQKALMAETGDSDDAVRTQFQPSSTGSGSPDCDSILQDLIPMPKVAPAPQDRLVLLNVVFWLALVSLLSFSKAAYLSNATTQKWIVGIAVNLTLLVFYAAPLSTIWTVLRTCSAATIHVPTMLTNTFNGCFWGAYGVAIFDWFIAVPHVLGAALGVVQIVLYYILFSTR